MTHPAPDAVRKHEMPNPRILFLCTGNAARSVMAGAALVATRAQVEVLTGGTLVLDGQPMSWRTRAALEHVGLTPPQHRSHQATIEDLDQADVIIALAPEHVEWVRRTHAPAAPRTATLARLARLLPVEPAPLTERIASMLLHDVELEPWEEVVDPGGGEVPQFKACAEEIVGLIEPLARALNTNTATAKLVAGR